MRDQHLDLDFLEAAENGEIPWREVVRHRRRHKDALCSGCDLRSEVFAAHLRDRARVDPAERGRCYAAVAEGWVDLAEAFAGDRPEVERDLAALRSGAPGLRARRVERERGPRFRSPLLAEALIDEARGRLGHDAEETLSWLAVARAVVERAETEVDSRVGHALLRDLRLRIRAHEGNARRVLGDLAGADRAFAEVRERAAAGEPPAIAVSAELASLEASLRRSQRRLPEAEALLERAEPFYRWERDDAGLAGVLVKRGIILYTEGDSTRAARCLQAAAAAVSAAEEPKIALSARHNLVLCLCAAGEAGAAGAVLERSRGLYRKLGDPATLDLLAWAEGKVAAGLGDDGAALERLGAVRAAYLERKLEYDAAMVGLDLAEVHLVRGETAEVKRLAEETEHALSKRGVDREAARAVAMFAKAALAEAVTIELIARTRTALLRAGGRPAGRR